MCEKIKIHVANALSDILSEEVKEADLMWIATSQMLKSGDRSSPAISRILSNQRISKADLGIKYPTMELTLKKLAEKLLGIGGIYAQ